MVLFASGCDLQLVGYLVAGCLLCLWFGCMVVNSVVVYYVVVIIFCFNFIVVLFG